jgi:ABC-type nickel/cobalt efflux system permease component RcnA
MSFQPLLAFISDDPMLRLIQGGLLLAGCGVVFMLFYATRDILLRTKSFAYQFASILIVAALPVVGFLLYLLIRPARTVKERQMEVMLKKILDQQKEHEKRHHPHHKHDKADAKRILVAKQTAEKVLREQQKLLEPVPV